MKVIIKSRKLTPKYEIRGEHVTYDDGRTEDRVVCYSFSGEFLGTIKQAESKLREIEERKAKSVMKKIRSK